MAWLKSNWCWAALNLFALSILAFVLNWGSTDWNATYTFDPGLESGKWAIRFLLICLAMTPLNTYFNWRGAIKLRKPAGLWTFGFAVLHVLFYLSEAQLTWLTFPMQPYIALGLLGLFVLSVLAITSNRWAMQRLRKYWKRLHRLVYLAGVAVTSHAILAASASKKIFLRDPQAIDELKLYVALLVVLLVVRIPLVRRVLKQMLVLLRPQRKVVPVVPVTLPDSKPIYWPKVYTHEVGIPLDDLYTEVQPVGDFESQQVVL
jgi:methionine sulfoxide reductase heme-binding subunit